MLVAVPVTVETPVQGEAVGPGTIVRASTLSVLPVGHHWDALIFEVGKQDTLVDGLNFIEGQSADFTLGVRKEATGEQTPIFQRTPAYAAAAGEFELHVRVISAQSTILDQSGPIGITWQPDPWGVAFVQSLQAGGTTDGSYLPADRQVAQNTLNAVRATFPGLGGLPGLVLDIGQLFTTPPVEVLRRAELLTLTGRGTLFYPQGGTDVQAYGAFIELVTPPAGAGFDDGVIQEFEVRMAQFAVIGRHGNTIGYVKNLYDLVNGGQYLIWGAPFPRRIDYDITPGFSVGWRWLVLGIQP